MQDILKLGLILGLVCAIAGASLSVVNAVTADVIVARQEQELNEKLAALVPKAQRFDKETLEDDDTVYYLGMEGDKIIGAVIENTIKGYGGEMRLLMAFDEAGLITGVEVLEHKETIGIGTQALAADFLKQFQGLGHENPPTAGSNVNLITGATVSSRAVMSGVSKGLDFYMTNVLKLEEDDWNLAKVKDGVYEGSAPGLADDIKVKVTVADGRITDVEVVYINDTPEYYPRAVEEVPGRIVEAQHWKVDAATGATISSDGIMAAVKAAMPDTSLKFEEIADGSYQGSGQGFGGEIKVKVEVAAGKVTKVEVLSHGETANISDPALEQIPAAIIEAQTVKVDAVSNATFTSDGIIEAVINALENAPLK